MIIINLNGIVGWDIMAEDINRQIDEADGDIIFDMNSGGGYITEGVAILNKIRAYNKGRTIARVSYSASMMTQIALACDEVHVYDNAIFMIHNAQGYASGDHIEMTSRAKHLKAMSDMLSNLYVKKTGKSKKEIQKMMDETTYMFGQQILDEGFADKLLDTDGEKDSALAIEAGSLNFAKVLDAIQEEGLSASDLSSTIKACKSGTCTLATMPSSEKIATNSKQGNTVKKTAEELQTLLDTAITTLDANKSAIDGKDAEILTLNGKVVALEASAQEFDTTLAQAVEDGIKAEVDGLKTEFAGIMAMVIEAKAPKDVALKMVECSTLTEAQVALAGEMRSAGITFGGEHQQSQASADNHGWKKIMKKGN